MNDAVGRALCESHAHRINANALQEQIKPLGQSTGVFPIMVHLWEQEGLSQKRLVERVGIEQARIADTLSRMERDGLIKRTRDVKDGRIRQTWLTERGRLEGPHIGRGTRAKPACTGGGERGGGSSNSNSWSS
ncbi:MarR family winged helix-turn-helix transcriptional regulator [Phaeobacter gallaeciensis]